MILKYKNEFQDYVNQYELVNYPQYGAARNSFLLGILIPVGFAALGMIGSYPSNIFMVCVIAAGLGMYLTSVLPFRAHYRRHLEASLLPLPERDIELGVREDGFVEQVEGIRSFCPWSSMAGYCIFRETLFVELKANVWAIIPHRSLTPDSPTIEHLVNILEQYGVKEMAAPPLPKG